MGDVSYAVETNKRLLVFSRVMFKQRRSIGCFLQKIDAPRKGGSPDVIG